MNDFGHKTSTQSATLEAGLKFPEFFTGDKEKVFTEILDGCVLPDIDENQNGYSHHFYNAVTNTNYLGTEDSAKARCLRHSAAFILSKDYKELGRAIHFLEDICTPVHSQYEDVSDSIIRGKLHLDFEKEFDEFLATYKPALPDELPKFDSPGKLIDFCALESAKNYYDYRDNNVEKNEIFKRTADLALMAVFKLCEFLYQGNPKAGYIKDGEVEAGVFLDFGKPEVATMADSYRLRANGENEVFIFEKPYTGRNFMLSNIIKIKG